MQNVIEIHPGDLARIDRMRGVFSRADLIGLVLDHFLKGMMLPVGLVVTHDGKPWDLKAPDHPLNFRPEADGLKTGPADPDPLQEPAPRSEPSPEPDHGTEETGEAGTASGTAGADPVAPPLSAIATPPALPGGFDVFAHIRELDEMMSEGFAEAEAALPGPQSAGPDPVASQTEPDDFFGDDFFGSAPSAATVPVGDGDFPGSGDPSPPEDDFPGFSADHGLGDGGDAADTGGRSAEDPGYFVSAPDRAHPGTAEMPMFDDRGEPIEDSLPKARPAAQPQQVDNFRSILSRMTSAFTDKARDGLSDGVSDGADADGNVWIGDDVLAPAGGQEAAVVVKGDIVIYRKSNDAEGVPTRSFLVIEIDEKVNLQQNERSINLDSRTVYTYQPAGKALIGARVGDRRSIKIPGEDAIEIEILTIMKPDRQ